jgi:hypothetical protein
MQRPAAWNRKLNAVNVVSQATKVRRLAKPNEKEIIHSTRVWWQTR